MLKITKTNTRTDVCNVAQTNTNITEHSVTGKVQLAGDSIWGYTGPSTVEVTGVQVVETTYADEPAETYTLVNVTHNATWDIYTDSAFENAISKLLGYAVCFTEQGMQENNYASLEAA